MAKKGSLRGASLRKSAISKGDSKGKPIIHPSQGHRWTFLTNHAHVLILLHRNPEIVLREVALEVGITERAVQRIIQDLEEEGFIHREKVGRRNQYEVIVDQPLRHPIESHKRIGELLNLVAVQ